MSGETDAIAVLVRIRGMVQGVGYRAWTEQAALRHGLDGWVRNRRDGSVEALIAGRRDAVDAMLEELWQGPPASDVTDIAREAADLPDSGFRVLKTE